MESINISKRNRYMRKILSHSLPIAKEKDQESDSKLSAVLVASQGALSQQAWFEQLLLAARDTQTLFKCREQGSSGPGPAATSIVPSVPSPGAPAPVTAAQDTGRRGL